MLRIDRIRIEIQTGEGLYGFDERLYDGLNFWQAGITHAGKVLFLRRFIMGLDLKKLLAAEAKKCCLLHIKLI